MDNLANTAKRGLIMNDIFKVKETLIFFISREIAEVIFTQNRFDQRQNKKYIFRIISPNI